MLWSGVDDFGKGFAEAKKAIALASLPMDRVLTVLTGLEAKRRAHPDEEWEVQNWDEHTLRPWEAVSKSLVRWGEQAEKLRDERMRMILDHLEASFKPDILDPDGDGSTREVAMRALTTVSAQLKG